MARPAKKRIDYFPFYCDYDERIEYLIAKYGFEGYGIYVSLLKNLYGGNGYYLCWNDKAACILARSGNTDSDRVADIIKCLLEEGIFDKDIYEQYGVLTSKEIQENYLYAVTKRKYIVIDERYKLVNSEKTEVISEKTRINSPETTQRKENNKRENKIIENNIKGECDMTAEPSTLPHTQTRGEYQNVFLTEAEYEELSRRYPDIDSSVERLSQYMAASGKAYASHFAVLNKWADEDCKRAESCQCSATPPSDNSSYDINEFFAAALRKSYCEGIT